MSMTSSVTGEKLSDHGVLWRQCWFWRLAVTLSVFALCAHFQTFNAAVTNSIYPVAYPWLEARYGNETGAVATHWGWGLMNTAYIFGLLVGVLNSGWIAEMCGRKNSFYGTGSALLVAGFLINLCKPLNFFHLATIGRLLLGMAVGVSRNATMLLMAETAPKRLRGAFFGFLGFALGVGVFAGDIVALPEVLIGGTADLWPLAMASGCLPAFFLLPVLLWAPESPRYLYVEKGDQEGSRQAVVAHHEQSPSFSATVLTMLVNVAVETSAVTVLISYSSTLLEDAGASHSPAANCSTLRFGLGKMLFALIPPLLLDTWGR